MYQGMSDSDVCWWSLIYWIGDDVTAIIDKINVELQNLHEWLQLNSLKVNINKTKFMLIKNKYRLLDTTNHVGVSINGHKIEQTTECKYLGVIIDEHLTFQQHSRYVTSKIAKKSTLWVELEKIYPSGQNY